MKRLILFFLITNSVLAQVGIGTTSPNAALDVTATTDGLLIPRVALVNTTTATVVTPTISELVYNTAIAGDVTPGFYYWDGGKWIRFLLSNTTSNSWALLGNAGTTVGTNFLGTTDNVDMVFKRNNIQAGKLTTTNTSFGVDALSPTTTRNRNTAIGVESLYLNTGGDDNIAIGYQALRNGANGARNIAVGNNALMNTSGNDNTAVGMESLRANTIGNNNVAVGRNSLQSNVDGSNNTAVGMQSLTSNTSGANNVAMGRSSLNQNSTGQQNSAFGMQTLSSNTSGNDNVAVGIYALLQNTTGGDNTAVGTSSLFTNTTGIRNVAIGKNALNQSTGSLNTALGYGSLSATTGGSTNTAIGVGSLNDVTTGSNNIGVGYNAQVPSPTNNNQVRIGDTNITYAGIQVAWTTTSDRRWKENIKPSNLGLDFINNLNPVSYTRKNDEAKKVEYGFIAQELEDTLLKFGVDNNGIISIDDNNMYGVRYNDLIAPLVLATQEQQKEIIELRNLIKELQLEVNSLKKK